MSSFTWPPIGSGGSGATIYANFAAFPSSAADGALAVAADTDFLYVFSTSSNSWIQITSGTTTYNVNYVTLKSTDISNKFITLSSAPTVPADTLLTVIGGPMQNYGIDYTVSGTILSWSGLFLDGVLIVNDILIIQFN